MRSESLLAMRETFLPGPRMYSTDQTEKLRIRAKNQKQEKLVNEEKLAQMEIWNQKIDRINVR